MKKILILLVVLAVMISFGLYGCAPQQPGNGDNGDNGDNGEQPAAYPNRPITIIAPAAPGGNYDTFARILISNGQKHFGVPMVVRNVPGAMFTIGMVETVRSAPDGYTFMTSSESANVYASKFLSDLEFKVEDVEYIVGMTAVRHTIGVPYDSPFQSITDMFEFARANPNTVTVGTSSPIYESMLLAWRDNGIEFVNVPQAGGAATGLAIAGNHIDVGIMGLAGAVPLHEGKLIRTLCITDNIGRMPDSMADVPSLHEFPEYAEMIGPLDIAVNMVMGPKGMPEELLNFIEETLYKVYQEPEFQRMSEELGIPSIWMSREDLQVHISELDALLTDLLSKYQ